MLIGIDGNEANVERRVGVNVYAFQIIRSIKELAEKRKHKIVVYLKNSPLPDLPKENEFFEYKILPGGGLWVLTKLMPHLFLSANKPDVLFTPSHYVPLFAPMPRVVAIMDLGYLEFSGQFKKFVFWQLKYWSAISIFVAKAIITISKSTKNDIVRHYRFASKKVSVTYPGYDTTQFNSAISEENVRRVKEKYSIEGDYLLFLGTLKPSKNIEGLIEAFSILKSNLRSTTGVTLVIAGKKGWLYETIFKKVKSLGLEDNVIFTDFVSEEDKPALMNGAKCFILPSFWEGFGLDALNAMAVGTPVVFANTGSLPEVVEDAGFPVDPNDPKSIAAGIDKVLSMNDLEYNKTVKRELTQAEKFSWSKTAEETLNVLETVV